MLNSQLHNSSPTQVGPRIIIDDRYLLKRLISKKSFFNIYECVDFKTSRLATAYVKPVNFFLLKAQVDFDFSKRIKEELRKKIAPELLWSGPVRIDKTLYKVEVHQKLGPSLKSMFAYVRENLSERDFLLLFYQLVFDSIIKVKLVQKFGSVGYVHRELNLDNIVFDPTPSKNQLFLLNVFPLKKRGDIAPAIQSKYCSRGAHLGLSMKSDDLETSVKDDLESVCYIMISIHTKGDFLRGIQTDKYNDAKANIDFSAFQRPLPSLFISFYSYVLNLNHSDQANYFSWRTNISKLTGKDTLFKCYEWMKAKNSLEDVQRQKRYKIEIDMIELQDEIKQEDKILFEKLNHQKIIFKRTT